MIRSVSAVLAVFLFAFTAHAEETLKYACEGVSAQGESVTEFQEQYTLTRLDHTVRESRLSPGVFTTTVAPNLVESNALGIPLTSFGFGSDANATLQISVDLPVTHMFYDDESSYLAGVSCQNAEKSVDQTSSHVSISGTCDEVVDSVKVNTASFTLHSGNSHQWTSPTSLEMTIHNTHLDEAGVNQVQIEIQSDKKLYRAGIVLNGTESVATIQNLSLGGKIVGLSCRFLATPH